MDSRVVGCVFKVHTIRRRTSGSPSGCFRPPIGLHYCVSKIPAILRRASKRKTETATERNALCRVYKARPDSTRSAGDVCSGRARGQCRRQTEGGHGSGATTLRVMGKFCRRLGASYNLRPRTARRIGCARLVSGAREPPVVWHDSCTLGMRMLRLGKVKGRAQASA